jgi:hypothetical protein
LNLAGHIVLLHLQSALDGFRSHLLSGFFKGSEAQLEYDVAKSSQKSEATKKRIASSQHVDGSRRDLNSDAEAKSELLEIDLFETRSEK